MSLEEIPQQKHRNFSCVIAQSVRSLRKVESCAISPKQCLKMESSPWVRKAAQSHIIATHLHGVHLHVFLSILKSQRKCDFSLWFSKTWNGRSHGGTVPGTVQELWKKGNIYCCTNTLINASERVKRLKNWSFKTK